MFESASSLRASLASLHTVSLGDLPPEYLTVVLGSFYLKGK